MEQTGEPKELLLFIQTSAARFKRLQASALLKAR